MVMQPIDASGGLANEPRCVVLLNVIGRGVENVQHACRKTHVGAVQTDGCKSGRHTDKPTVSAS